MLKRFLAAFLFCIVSTNVFVFDSVAIDIKDNEYIEINDAHSITKRSMLTIKSGNNAECTSIYDAGIKTYYSVKGVQTLEKKGVLGIFFEVDNATWEKTEYSEYLEMSNDKGNLSNGVYRLKTVFTITMNNGSEESVTVYSTEKTVN